jgi:hypothetical protein
MIHFNHKLVLSKISGIVRAMQLDKILTSSVQYSLLPARTGWKVEVSTGGVFLFPLLSGKTRTLKDLEKLFFCGGIFSLFSFSFSFFILFVSFVAPILNIAVSSAYD